MVAECTPDGLSPKQQEAILALLSEPSILKAAGKVDVTERTIRRWMDEPVFAAEFRKARRDAYGQAIGLTQRYAPMAVNALVKVMADSAAPPQARVSAATAVLKLGREGIELDDLAARIDALEQAVNPDPQPPRTSPWGSRAA